MLESRKPKVEGEHGMLQVAYAPEQRLVVLVVKPRGASECVHCPLDPKQAIELSKALDAMAMQALRERTAHLGGPGVG